MKYISLDGNLFKDVAITHKILKEKLELPDYYGENLDALWDCLTGGIELSVCIKWSNYKASCHYLGEYAEKLRNVFEDAATELDNFSLQIEEEIVLAFLCAEGYDACGVCRK